MRIGGSSATSFAKLPDAGKLNGGKATQCHDLEFGIAGTPFAGKLYAVANGNATIYEIDSSGKAKAFATFDGTPSFEISSLSFTAPNDPKAPNSMLAGMRPRLAMSRRRSAASMCSRSRRQAEVGVSGRIRQSDRMGLRASRASAAATAGNLFIVDAGKAGREEQCRRADGAFIASMKKA